MNIQASQATQSKTSMVDAIYGNGATAQELIEQMERGA